MEKYQNQILDLIDNRDDFDRSDLQGIVEIIVRKIAHDESLLSFETRLSRSKSSDLF
jgi:hypothetical protein